MKQAWHCDDAVCQNSLKWNSTNVSSCQYHSELVDVILTVQVGTTINSENRALSITAWDLDLDGSVDTGTSDIRVYGMVTGQTIGFGQTIKQMHIDSSEVQRISATGLTVGGKVANVTVDGINASNSA